MEKHDVTLEDLERLTAAMAEALPALDCPEGCDRNWKFDYVEMSAQLYNEHREWACLATVLLQYRNPKKPGKTEG